MKFVIIGFSILLLGTQSILGCGEDENSKNVYHVRKRRDTLSENIIVGVDYLGKPKIACHCDSTDITRLTLNNLRRSQRSEIIRVKKKPKSVQMEKRDFIYAPTCCKIDLTNPMKIYSYPFTLRLPEKEFDDKLTDASSKEFQELKNQLINSIEQLLIDETCIVAIDISQFRKGSVLADIALSMKGPISQSIIDKLKSAVDSGLLGELRVEVVADVPENQESSSPTPSPTASPVESGSASVDSTAAASVVSSSLPSPTATVTASSASTQTTNVATPVTVTTTVVSSSSTAELNPTTASVTTTIIPTSLTATPAASVVVVASLPIQTSAPSAVPSGSTVIPSPTMSQGATVTPTATPSTTPAPVMRPERPVDARPSAIYKPESPGKEFKVAVVFTEKSFDPALNNPTSLQFQELKRIIEQSLTDVFRANPSFLSLTVLNFRPAVFKSGEESEPEQNFQLRESTDLRGVEVTLDIKFRDSRPAQLVPLETQLKIGTIATHKVSQEMAAVIIRDEEQSCPSPCRQPAVCYPQCSPSCCIMG